MTADELKEHFSRCGHITDVRLVHTRAGIFRRFGFVGYATEKQAEEAVSYFHNTFIGSSRVEVQIAKPYGDKEIPRPWSKYSTGSSAYQEKQAKRNQVKEKRTEEEGQSVDQERQQRLNQDQHKSKLMSMLSDYYQLESDPEFAEFMATHKNKSSRHGWTNDESMGTRGEEKRKGTHVKPSIVSVQARRPGGEGVLLTRTHIKFGEEEKELNENEEKEMTDEKNEDIVMSDMDYLRSKVVCDGSKNDIAEVEKTEVEADGGGDRLQTTAFTLKMRGLPFNATEEDVQTFFYPLHLAAVRMPLDSQGRPSGSAFVDFNCCGDLQEALRRNKDCMGHRYIELFTDKGPHVTEVKEEKKEKLRPWEKKEKGDEEPIADSGRLFVRNLSYSITEDDLTELFSKYGPITELNLLVDRGSGQSIGLAFITFMFPEHAVKAVEELDGQIYQGRLLHILPARPRRVKDGEEEAQEENEGTSYKKQKAKQQKKGSEGGHSWNSLFLGSNAIVDAMADQYGTTKSTILDADSTQSLAVRMALGETQLVAEAREFLEKNGVKLDVFDQQRPKRSKTIILVKNLPFDTTSAELTDLFSRHGSISRLVLPPHGVSALVEYSTASNARSAFSKLEHTEFKHLPLYLEWAPLGSLGERTSTDEVDEPDKEVKQDEITSQSISTIFVKNLNFSTTSDCLKAVFSSLPGFKKCSVATKMNMKDPSKPLSMGYGFAEFSSNVQAMKAIKTLQGCTLDDHKLELKLSHSKATPTTQARKTVKNTAQKSAKILVRNVPFEATRKELWQLFNTFGELKLVRLPQKYGRQQGEHRGFGFVEFVTKEDAKRAMEALGHSTHLYGRRLVMEWADEQESVEDVRKRTARYFHGSAPPVKKKQRVSELLSSLTSRGIEDQDNED